MQQKSFSMAYLFVAPFSFFICPPLLKFGYATETELPSHGAMLQVSGLADIGRKEESKDDGKVNWHLQQLLEI